MPSIDVVLSATQRGVLVALKRCGEATADELSDTLGTSASAVRQHLSALRSAGFVATHQERGHNGRPADRYYATNLTEPLFAPTDGLLSVELLEHIDAEDPELVGRIFARRRQHMVERAATELAETPIGERVIALAGLLDEQGYLASSEHISDVHYRINLHSCAVWTVANRYEQACASELDFIRDLIPEATVERMTHKTAGAHTCAYEITLRS